MPPAPAGAVVRITYDANPGVTIAEGDFLRTAAGRLYRVLDARRTRSEKYPHRWRLALLVLREIPPDADPLAIVHPLVFNRRDRR